MTVLNNSSNSMLGLGQFVFFIVFIILLVGHLVQKKKRKSGRRQY